MGANNSSQTQPHIETCGRFHIHQLNLLDGSTSPQYFLQSLREEGFAIFDLYASESSQFERECVKNLYSSAFKFFSVADEHKMKHEDPKGENLGYINIPKKREYLKLRRTGDRNGQWPEEIHSAGPNDNNNSNIVNNNNNSSTPDELKESFLTAFSSFENISWSMFLSLLSDKESHPVLKESDLGSVLEAIKERASISINHYYKQDGEGMIDVCSSHRDTGLLTLIVGSETPGLQVWDRKESKWLDIEQMLVQHQINENPSGTPALFRYLIVIMGEKIQMFTGNNSLIPTDHRVVIPAETDRHSILYFMDVAK